MGSGAGRGFSSRSRNRVRGEKAIARGTLSLWTRESEQARERKKD